MAQLTDTSAKNMNTDGRIGFGQLMAYGSGGIIPIALFNIAGILVGLMGNISLGLSAFWLGSFLSFPAYGTRYPTPLLAIYPITSEPRGVGVVHSSLWGVFSWPCVL